jgi:hypothetical protein
MRRTHRNLLWLSLSFAVACGSNDDGSSDGAVGALKGGVPASASASDDRESTDPEGDDSEGDDSEGDDSEGDDSEGDGDEGDDSEECGDDDELDCTDGEDVHVEFGCDEVVITSCKDLSNVVLEFADGSRERFEGLSDQEGAFSGTGEHEGDEIVGVWVKAGANHSGDGPGYGERFDAGEQDCGEGDDPEQPEEPQQPEEPGDGDGDGDDSEDPGVVEPL